MRETSEDAAFFISHNTLLDAAGDAALPEEIEYEAIDEASWKDDSGFHSRPLARYLHEIHETKVPDSAEQASYARALHERKEELFRTFLLWAHDQTDFEAHCCAYEVALWRAYEEFYEKNGRESFQMLEDFFAAFDCLDLRVIDEEARKAIQKRISAQIITFSHRSLKGKKPGIAFKLSKKKRAVKKPLSDTNEDQASDEENSDGVPYWRPVIIEWLERLALPEVLVLRVLDVRAKENEFMKRNLPLVVPIASYYAPKSSISIRDLIQEGNLGLKKSVERFDHRKKFEFSTSAVWWIRNAILRAIGDQTGALRIPAHKREDQWALAKKRKQGIMSNTVDPLLLEAQSSLWGIDHPISLSTARWLDESSTLEDSIPDRSWERTMKETSLDEVSEVVRKILEVLNYHKILTPREEIVLGKRFGLFGSDEDDMPLTDIGKKYLGVSRERARQYEAKALQKILGYIELNPEVRDELAELGWSVPFCDDDNEEEKTAKARRRAYFLQ